MVKYFKIDADRIDVLNTPQEFHQELLKRISNAKYQIQLVSLYCGCELDKYKTESDLITALSDAIKANPQLQVDLTFDHFRSNRLITASDGQSTSGREVLETRVKSLNASNVNLHMYKSGAASSLLTRLFGDRNNEIFSILHVKIYKFDNVVILSGANLSASYFTNRQDRYYVLNLGDCDNDGTPFDKEDDSLQLNRWYDEFIRQLNDSGDYQNLLGDDCSVDSAIDKSLIMNSNKAMVIPMFNVPHLKIWQSQQSMISILNYLAKLKQSPQGKALMGDIDITSGYFIPTADVSDALYQLSKDSTVNITIPSVRTNGFYQGKGVSYYVPTMYQHVASQFIDSTSSGNNLRLLEYDRNDDGWSYHAKGLFVNDNRLKMPFITILGSSNWNYRSAYRDVEQDNLIITWNHNLRSKMWQEQSNLAQYTRPFQRLSSQGNSQGSLYLRQRMIRLASKVFRSFL
ncbi:hypothetical protein MP228_006934 [Amoeboaphelidium protococcarum]|nr:hypothetical protein MP228_006934 [Amoeboaphelidium protococcarum]